MRMLFAGLVAGVAGLLAWLIVGLIMANLFGAEPFLSDKIMSPSAEVNLIGLFLADLVFGCVLAYAAWKSGILSLFNGLFTGITIGFLVYASMDLLLEPIVHVVATSHIVFGDILLNSLWAASWGAIAGLVLTSSRSKVPRNVAIYR